MKETLQGAIVETLTNERKVAKGVAQLIEIKNFGALDRKGKPTPEELVEYLQSYSERNSKIKKAQFHVAISCKGHEMTEEQLLDFAHQYLKEMGYMEEGQPLLVYARHDTDNTHLHIVTSRVAPNGRKIAHDHERRRSQQVIDRILGNNRKEKVEKDIETAKQCTFSSFAQFEAVRHFTGWKVKIEYEAQTENASPTVPNNSSSSTRTHSVWSNHLRYH